MPRRNCLNMRTPRHPLDQMENWLSLVNLGNLIDGFLHESCDLPILIILTCIQPAKFAAAKGNCRRNCLLDYWVRQQKTVDDDNFLPPNFCANFADCAYLIITHYYQLLSSPSTQMLRVFRCILIGLISYLCNKSGSVFR